MKRSLWLLGLLLLAACATPQEQCISSASAEYNTLMSRIATARGNIERGYAIHSQQVPYTYIATCYDDTGTAFDCEKTGYRTDETPVAIDIGEERRKLSRLEAQLPGARAARDAGIAQCRVEYPE